MNGKTSSESKQRKSQIYKGVVILVGLSLWVLAALQSYQKLSLKQFLILLSLIPLTIAVGYFSHTFKLPSGLKSSQNSFTFTFVDSIVLVIVCTFGIFPAVFVHGVEGFFSAIRGWKKFRLSSYTFSSAMMSIATGVAGFAFYGVLTFGFGEIQHGLANTVLATSVSFFVASIVHFVVNLALICGLLVIREDISFLHKWKELFFWNAPLFLPTGSAASITYLALRFDVTAVFGVLVPLFLAIYFGHKQYCYSFEQRIKIMEKAHRETIEALAVAINAKDEVTHDHVMRVQIYAAGVAKLFGCSEAEVEALKAGALLHDIGKIAVPDHILNKPGKLTATEFEKMKMHTIAGAQILSRVEFPYPIVPVVRHHHERWDGKGYPDGLANENIPLTARILSVVDCFDAVREDRQYRKGLTREQAINLIMEGSGTQYDPRVVGTFIANLPVFEAEIQAMKDKPLQTFGIEPTEQLSEAARSVAPAAGLAEDEKEIAVLLSDKKLREFYNFTQAINEARHHEELFEVFSAKLSALVPYDTCSITLVEPNSGDNLIVHGAGKHGASLVGRKISQGEGVTGWVLVNGKQFCNSDPKLDFPPSLTQVFSEYKTLASFPIRKGREVLGAVTLYSCVLNEYSEEHQKLTEEATALLATAFIAIPPSDKCILTEKNALSSSTPIKPALRANLNLTEPEINSELTH